MKAVLKYVILISVALATGVPAFAQWTFDVPSIEAYVNDHKQQKSLLLARSTLEQSNRVLHNYSRKEVSDYKALNEDLDDYTRAFDVIDILYQSLRLAFNGKETYDIVSQRIKDYKAMLTDYNEKILKRGKVELIDTRIITINQRAIQMISIDLRQLYNSINDLALYATGAAQCSTADLVVILESINRSMDMIQAKINSAYFETWKFIQLRIGYWKSKVYRRRTKAELAEDAFGRWRENGKL